MSASSDNKDVKVEVKQARPDAETAVVTFDYQGMVKTYNVVFSRSFVVMGMSDGSEKCISRFMPVISATDICVITLPFTSIH